VQQLDPAGVAARNLQECLSIQLQRKEQNPDVELALKIIEKAFEQFTKKHYKKLMQKFSIDEEQLKDAVKKSNASILSLVDLMQVIIKS